MLARPPKGPALFVRDEKLVRMEAQATRLLDFCMAKRIGLLLVSVSEPPQQHGDKWASFLSRAHSRGLKVHALGGAPEWGLGTERRGRSGTSFAAKAPFEHLNGIVSYNFPRPSKERFDGLVHEMDVWATGRYQGADGAEKHSILSFYVEILRGCRRAARSVGQGIDYGAVIPPDAETEVIRAWEDAQGHTYEYTGPLYAHVIGVVDYVIVRDHADAVDRLLDAARDEVQTASRLDVLVYLAVQTARPNGIRSEATFGDDGEAAMQGALSTVGEAFGEHRAFRGVAIDCYRTYRSLGP